MDERCYEEIRQNEEDRIDRQIARREWEEDNADDLRDSKLYDTDLED